ncbi:MAG: nucleotidyltransferase [Candidatus Jordarchaeaceae archaeon]
MSLLDDFLSACQKSNVRYALVGAWALIQITRYRTTHDVDVAVLKTDLWKFRRALEEIGYFYIHNPRLGKHEFKHVEKGDIDVYTETIGGVPIEQLIERALTVVFEGRNLRCISPEDLILVKLIAGRERDKADVAVILYYLIEKLDWRYLNEEAKKLNIKLGERLISCVERLPITVVNPHKVRKNLTEKINDLSES